MKIIFSCLPLGIFLIDGKSQTADIYAIAKAAIALVNKHSTK